MTIAAEPAPSTPRSTLTLAVLASVGIGVLIALQSRVNGELGRELDDAYLAALISFGSGLVITSVALLFWRPGRRGMVDIRSAVRERRIPWWYLGAGAIGALFVVSQSLSGAVIGVAMFTIAVVCGQTISGLLIDRNGIGLTPPSPITVTRLLGAVIALVAVGWAVSPHLGGDIPLWMLLLPFIAGLGVGLQQAMNGQLKLAADSALPPTFLNFVTGSLVLVVAAGIHLAFAGLPSAVPANPLLYTGGLIGVVFVGAIAMVVRTTGLLLLGLASTSGQLLTSLLLDLIVPLPGHVLAAATVGGTALTLVAVGVAAFPSRIVRRR
ncbi:DMT family transporter [soil metagenome]